MKRMIATTAAGLFAALAAIGAANAASRVEVGLLNCSVAGGTGFIFGSSKSMNCVFKHVDGSTENYSGEINKWGIDIGRTEQADIVWAVLAPSRDIPPGALAGRYAGLSAEATAGVGIGANAMVGGFEKSIALQPFSVQAQKGLNIAAGVGGMELWVQ
ncbi:MAG: DUF992 domain-containing protein [Hyphomicrobiales bacterium]|nr:DUF992 domain-containing protein [Hyphomicrobiales bacterium]